MKTLRIQLNQMFIMVLVGAFLSVTSTLQAYGHVPENLEAFELRFSEFKCNVKDYHRNILFTAQNEECKYYFLKDGLSMRMPESTMVAKPTPSSIDSRQINLRWEGINSSLEVVAADELKMKRNTKDCVEKQFRKLFYNQLYPGIDLMYADKADQLELDFQIEAGFNHSDIKFKLEGAQDIRVDALGRLLVRTNGGEIIFDKPMAQQEGKPLTATWVFDGQWVSLQIKNASLDRFTHVQTQIVQKDMSL